MTLFAAHLFGWNRTFFLFKFYNNVFDFQGLLLKYDIQWQFSHVISPFIFKYFGF